jgi:hypothetical protein
MIRYICQLQLCGHPVAVVQYTFTHKQYTERHKTNYIKQHKNFGNSAGRAPSLRVIPWHLPYNWGRRTEKPQGSLREPAGTMKIHKTYNKNFNILLTVHLNAIIVFFTNLIHKFSVLLHLLQSSTCFEHYAHPQEVKSVSVQPLVSSLWKQVSGLNYYNIY